MSARCNTQPWSVWYVPNVVLLMFMTGSMGPRCFGLDLCACVHFRWSRHHARISQEEVWRPAHSDLHERPVSHSLHLHQNISKKHIFNEHKAKTMMYTSLICTAFSRRPYMKCFIVSIYKYILMRVQIGQGLATPSS